MSLFHIPSGVIAKPITNYQLMFVKIKVLGKAKKEKGNQYGVDHQANQHHDEIFALLKVLIINMVTQGNQRNKKHYIF
jgi:hypothetical protein